jgi:hypothetical protein
MGHASAHGSAPTLGGRITMIEIALFLLLLFGVTWPWGYFVTPLAMSQGQAAFLASFLPLVWMPTLIALALLRYTQGAEAVKREIRARLSSQCGLPMLLFAGLTPLLVGAAAMGVARVGGGVPPSFRRWRWRLRSSFRPSAVRLARNWVGEVSCCRGSEHASGRRVGRLRWASCGRCGTFLPSTLLACLIGSCRCGRC